MDEVNEKLMLIDDLVEEILNDTPATQKPDHLVRFWICTPPEMCNPLFPGIPTRIRYLARYILEADRDPAARVQLFGLHEYLMREGEEPPYELRYWVDHFVRNGPVVRRRGPREESWRDYNVYLAFQLLRSVGRSYECSLATVAKKAGLDPEGARSILRKIKRNSPVR